MLARCAPDWSFVLQLNEFLRDPFVFCEVGVRGVGWRSAFALRCSRSAVSKHIEGAGISLVCAKIGFPGKFVWGLLYGSWARGPS